MTGTVGLTTATHDARDRLDYLAQVADAVWPHSAVRTHRRPMSEPAARQFLLLPSTSKPRLLVPAGSGRAGAVAIRGYGEQNGRRGRVVTRLAAAALRGGAGRVWPHRVCVRGGAAGLHGHLESLFGEQILISVHLGPPRANRKPVLQLIRPDGGVLGFAKVGTNELTRRLVANEEAALRRLGGTAAPGMLVPSVLHAGSWQQLDFLVQSPLELGVARRPVTETALYAAMARVADIGRSGPAAIVGGAYWSSLSTRVARLPAGPVAAGLRGAFGRLSELTGDDALATGAWHGDWTPWNMAGLRGGLAVWDWERFGAGVPVGFDALHYALQSELVSGRAPDKAVAHVLDHAARLLDWADVDQRGATITAAYYLTDIATRYTEDGQADAGARFGRVQDWLLPVLGERLEGLIR